MATERVWSTLPPGHDGWRSVCAVLAREGVRVPTRLVQASLVELRRDARERQQQRIEQNRQHVEVLARNAVWAMDKMHVARDAHGVLEAEVVRETVAPHALVRSLDYVKAEGVSLHHTGSPAVPDGPSLTSSRTYRVGRRESVFQF